MITIAIDFETTGLNTQTALITEVAMKTLDGIDSMSMLSKPVGGVPPAIARITGITDELVADAVTEGELVRALIDWVEARSGADDMVLFVAHNAPYDRAILTSAMARAQTAFKLSLSVRWYDTLAEARKYLPGPKYTLTACLNTLSSPLAGLGAHRAMADVEGVLVVYRQLLVLTDAAWDFDTEVAV